MKLRDKILLLVLLIVTLLCLFSYQASGRHKTKVLLVGLDGASWNVINPLIKSGRLPNIKRLMDTGCYGVMRTFHPLVSEIIWTSIATGKTKEKHSINNRLIENPDDKKLVPVSSNLRNCKAIWDILSQNNKRVGVVNYMATWPSLKVNGVMVSGRSIALENVTYASKNNYYPAIKEICTEKQFESFKDYKADLFAGIEKHKFPGFLLFIYGVDNFMANFAKYLLKRQDFDFFCLYLRGTDIVSHSFWKYAFPEGSDLPKEDIQKYKDVLNNYYIFCDKVIGDMVKRAGGVDSVIIASDHGFQAKPKGRQVFAKMDHLLELCKLNRIKTRGKVAILKNESQDPSSPRKKIRITGCATAKEFDDIKNLAKDILSRIIVKETGDHIFEIENSAQDMLLVRIPRSYKKLNPGRHLIINGKEYSIADFLVAHPDSGMHSKYAIIIISGKNIKRNQEIKNATIYDITPTILYYLGLPIARDMDGKVLSEAIKDDYLRENPVSYINTYETGKKSDKEKPIRSSDEDEIKEMMRSLGYIN